MDIGVIQAFMNVTRFLTTAGKNEMEVCPREYLTLERHFMLDIENGFGSFEFFFKGKYFHFNIFSLIISFFIYGTDIPGK